MLLPVVLSYFIYRILLSRAPEQATWVALAFLFAPPNIINVLFTTDTPLIFFSFVSAWYFYKALYESENYSEFLICGLTLGLAFFSKYFAVLLGIAFGLYIVFFSRSKRNYIGLLLVFSVVLIFAGINIYWNYTHCWNNILFNFFNRTADSDDPVTSFIKYLVMMVYLFSPVLIYYLARNFSQFKELWQDKFNQVFLWLILLPYLLFIFVLFRKEVGLHWLLGFYPFVFISLASVLSVKQWKYVVHFMWVFSVVHVVALSSLLLLPVNTFSEKYEAEQNLTIGKFPDEVFAFVNDYSGDYHFTTISYSTSAVASYHSRKHFGVFNVASYHAREDDSISDYSQLDGKNIVIFKKVKNNLPGQAEFFETSELKTFYVDGVSFELLIGKGFKYDLYYEKVIKQVNQRYYQVPKWLPVGKCEFKEKYQL